MPFKSFENVQFPENEWVKECQNKRIFLKNKFVILDIAIGAPYEENGVVYIYNGRQSGIIVEPSQVRIILFEKNMSQIFANR